MFRPHSIEEEFQTAVNGLEGLSVRSIANAHFWITQAKISNTTHEQDKKCEEQGLQIRRGLLLLFHHQYLLGENKLREEDERAVTKNDGDQILCLYEKTALASDNPGLFHHLKLTAAFAEGIALRRRETRRYAPALRAMGLLRNIGAFFANGYRSRELLTHIICGRLGIRKIFRDYLRPHELSVGPLNSGQYNRFDPRDREKILHDTLVGTYRALTAKQRVLEYSGFRAKVKDGRILTFRQIQKTLQPTRESREAYERSVQETAVWAVDDDAHDRLSPEFSWAPIYEKLHKMYGPVSDPLRRKLQRQLNEGEL